jgi:GT2 family glycosyltransferase
MLEAYTKLPQIQVYFNLANLGLFPNLNQCIEYCQGDYIMILQQDDRLLPESLAVNLHLMENYPDAGLILAPQNVIDSNGKVISRDHANSIFFKNLKVQAKLLESNEAIPLLLQYGCIAGSLTGYFFRRELYNQIGSFKDRWKYAADWEWLYRVANRNKILVAKTNGNLVRWHAEQVSNNVTLNINKYLEAIEVVNMLLASPFVNKFDSALDWALNNMEHNLWLALKLMFLGRWLDAWTITKAISKSTGLFNTLCFMLKKLPQRLIAGLGKNFSISNNEN